MNSRKNRFSPLSNTINVKKIIPMLNIKIYTAFELITEV